MEQSGKTQNEAEEFVKFVAITATPKAMTTQEVDAASSDNKELSELWKSPKRNKWETPECKKYIPVNNELCVIGKPVLQGIRIVIPQILTLAHKGHIGIVSMEQRLGSKV